MSYIRYHGVLLWNDLTDNWLRVGTWFGTRSAPVARIQARGLVHPLFIAQTTWFGMPDVCSAKGQWVERERTVGPHGACEVTFIKKKGGGVLLEKRRRLG